MNFNDLPTTPTPTGDASTTGEKKLPPVHRSSRGLCDAMFDALDGARAKTTTSSEVYAMARAATAIVQIKMLEMKVDELMEKKAAKEPADAIRSITLGTT